MTSQLPPPKRLERLLWLEDPDAVTIRTEGPRLILRCGPFSSMESVFPCGFEDQEPPKRLGKLLRLLDLLLDDEDSDGDD